MRLLTMPMPSPSSLCGTCLWALFALAASALPSQAAVNAFGAGMAASGTLPFDNASGPGLDASPGDAIVRTFDTVTYRVGYSLTPTDSNNLITVTMGATALPSSYVGSANPQIAYFSVLDLPTGAAGCLNIQAVAVADPPPLGQSGVTADGKKIFCYQGTTGGANMPFTMRVAGTAPNGTTIAPPTFVHQSASTPAIQPTEVWNAPSGATPTYGLPTLTVSAAPRWKVTKTAAVNGTTFIPGSGPNGENGYIAAFNVGVYAPGSRKGLEAIQPPFTITENYSNPSSNPQGGVPNIRLVDWKVNSPGFASFDMSSAGQGGCGDWRNQLSRLGNTFDNSFYNVNDYNPAPPTATNAAYTVSRGGSCVATAVDSTNKTATLTLTGTDFSLFQYPVRGGSGAGQRVLVDVANLDNPSNEWWVASKSVLFWVPSDDLTLNVQEWLNNTVTLSGQSITGQANPASSATDRAGLLRTAGGTMSKLYTAATAAWTVAAGVRPAACDPNHTGDCAVNQASPGQVLAARVNTYNIGATDLGAGYVCEKIDNARLQFADFTSSAYPESAGTVKDASTGVVVRYMAGATTSIDFVWELGVGGTGTTGGTWTSFNTVASEYPSTGQPATDTAATHSGAVCGDGDATWYPSVAALLSAGHSLSEVSRVRGRYTTFPASVQINTYIPMMVNGTYAYSGTDNAPGGAFTAGNSTYGAISPNQAYWTRGSNPARASEALRIIGTEYARITKTAQAPHQPNNATVTRGSFVTYNLQVNLTSTTDPRTTDVIVWDVLPKYMSYVPGSGRFGGALLPDPVCAAPGVTPTIGPFPANSVTAGFTACYWTLRKQPVALAAAGDAAGDLPLISFETVVDLAAPGQTSLLNTSFVDSTNNLSPDAAYSGPNGFKCLASPVQLATCNFSNWTLRTVDTSGIVLHKQVDQPIVAPNTGFQYALDYAAVGPALSNARILDVLPATTDGRTSTFSGTLQLTGPIAAPVAESGPPATSADPNVVVLYTSNAPTNINRDPYHASQVVNGGGSNSATTTNWCTGFTGGACPASAGAVTAFMVLPRAKSDATLPSGVAYRLRVNVVATGNMPGNLYLNDFIGDSPGLDARRPGSNRVQTLVAAPDVTVSKTAAPPTIPQGGQTVFTLVVRNDSGANVSEIRNLPGTVISLVDNLPTGLQAQLPVTATDWNCAASTATRVQCTYSGALPVAAGAQLGAPILVTAIGQQVGSFTNAAGVAIAGQTEARTDNNGATAGVVVQAVPTTVSGRVYVEASDPANTQDDGNKTDPGLSGVTVRLLCTSPAYDQTTTTAADGSYSFANVMSSATCTLKQTQPSGYENAYNTQGAGATSSSDVSYIGDSSITLLVPITGSTGNNFAERKVAEFNPKPVPVLGWPALLLLSLLLPLGGLRRLRGSH